MKTKFSRGLSFLWLLLILSVFLIPQESLAQSITYGGAGFTENEANDGSVSGEITAILLGDNYLAPLDINTDVILGNIPTGLVPSISVEPGTANWTVRVPAEVNRWVSVTYGNGLFVAVARNGPNRVMTSPDGIIWTARAAANQWRSVTYGNGLFVAVGHNSVMTSPDGITWTARTAAGNNAWWSVTYGNGLFVAVAITVGLDGPNRVMTSPDGITWTARTAAEIKEWYSVTYGNGLFVAVGFNSVMTSPDGVTWTARTATENNGWQSVAYGNGLFVAVAFNGTNRVMTSPDGITWTARAATENNAWRSVTYGNGQFVAVASSGPNRVMTSPDGITWAAWAAAENNDWQSVTYGDGQFVAVAFDGTNRVMTASAEVVATLTLSGNANNHVDANDVADITFDFADSAFSIGPAADITNATGSASSNLGVDFENPAQITYGSTGFTENEANDGSMSGEITATLLGDNYLAPLDINTDVILGNIPTGLVPSISVEPGTANWTARVPAENNRWVSVTYGNGLFVAVARNGPNRVMTSPDGITWTARAVANQWRSVTYGNGLFVAVDSNGPYVMTSPDGIIWTIRTAAEPNSWFSVTYGNGLFVAVATSGTNRVMTSSDGITWTARAAAEANSWFSVTYANGQFVAVASNGTNRVMTSPDAINWTARAAAENNSWFSVTYGNGQFVAVATNGFTNSGTNLVMTSPDGIAWTARAAAVADRWSSVTYGNGQFVAVASSSAINSGTRVMTSPDGITWAAWAAAENNDWQSVTYGDGKFVAVAFDGTNRVMTASAEVVATLTLSGNANNHADANDVADITFDFADSAFSIGPAADITNATGPVSSNLGVDFEAPPAVNLSVSNNAGSEAASTVITVTATAAQAVAGNQTVNLGVSGMGITNSDYLLSNTTITILDGMTTGSVTFSILSDMDIEISETATLSINGVSAGLALGTTLSLDIFISDMNLDLDNDTILNAVDNCPNTANVDQADFDDDNIGDVCDADIDGDGMSNDYEESNGLNPRDPLDRDMDADADGFTNGEEADFGTDPNVADTDANNNGIPDAAEERKQIITPILKLLILDEDT